MADATAPEAVLVEETRLGRYQVAVRTGGSSLLADEPVAFGGLGSGPGPYDLLCAGLGACTAMTLRLYADQKGWPLERVRVHVTHKRGASAERDHFKREILLDGPLDETQRSRLLEIAGRCPVHRTLDRGADVFATLGEPAGPEAQSSGQHMADMTKACAD